MTEERERNLELIEAWKRKRSEIKAIEEELLQK